MKRIIIIFCLTVTFLLSYANPAAAGTTSSSVPAALLQDVKSAIRQAEARFESGNVSGAADLARKILEKYPENAEAQAILDKCIATEKSEFESAVASLNVAALSAFQEKYPSSAYNDEIVRYIADIPLWKSAKEADSIESYNKYLAESSHLLFRKAATDRIAKLSAYRFSTGHSSTNNSYTDKSYTLEYDRSENTTTSTVSEEKPARSKQSAKSIRFGLTILADLGYYSRISGDLWYDGLPFSLGIGGLVRFGDQRKRLNFITGCKMLYSNLNITYTHWEDYSHYKETDSTSSIALAVPLELNWNILTSEYAGVYLGIGYRMCLSSGVKYSQALKVSFGASWTHGDWKIYYLKYFNGPIDNTGKYSPFVGTSYTYYF